MQGLIVLHGNMTDLDDRHDRVPMDIDQLVTRFTDRIVAGLRG